MSTDWVQDLNMARALTWRYVVALFLVASLSSAAWISLHLVIREQEGTAALVNISGRQRMLSQRTALFCNLLVNAPISERPSIREKLKNSIALMEASHRGLTHGDAAMKLPETRSPAMHALYFDGPDPLDRQVQNYVGQVNDLLNLAEQDLSPDTPLLKHITQTASTTLLSALDNVVRGYQSEGEASVGRLQKAETIFWLATLLLLMLEAVLIFRPFARHIRAIIEKLKTTGEALQQHHDQLEETVKQRTNELSESEEKFRLISTNAKDAIVIVGEDEQITYWNPAAEELFGYSANEAIGKNLHNLLTPERYRDEAHKGYARFMRYGMGELIGKTFDITALKRNGEEFPIALSISAFAFKKTWHALGIIRDITERKQMEKQVHQLAFYDALTTLPNRRLFSDRLNHAIAVNRRSRCHGAVMFLDLDNFKPLNDTYGHGVGDLLLIEAAKRLKNSARDTDTVARFGGDEFVVILTELDKDKAVSAEEAQIVAEKIRAALSAPYALQSDGAASIEHCCTVSIGIAVFMEQNPDDVMKYADEAMYLAKTSGRNQIRLYGETLTNTAMDST